MEMDNHKGSGNSYTTPFRQYDPRLGRWLTQDPIVHPWSSPFTAFNNNPIYFVDPSGLSGGTSKSKDGTVTYSGDAYDSKGNEILVVNMTNEQMKAAGYTVAAGGVSNVDKEASTAENQSQTTKSLPPMPPVKQASDNTYTANRANVEKDIKAASGGTTYYDENSFVNWFSHWEWDETRGGWWPVSKSGASATPNVETEPGRPDQSIDMDYFLAMKFGGARPYKTNFYLQTPNEVASGVGNVIGALGETGVLPQNSNAHEPELKNKKDNEIYQMVDESQQCINNKVVVLDGNRVVGGVAMDMGNDTIDGATEGTIDSLTQKGFIKDGIKSTEDTVHMYEKWW